MREKNICCIFGHREMTETEELRTKLTETIENLITEKQVDTFLFGSRSDFDRLCLQLVTELKEKYPHVRRVYVRAEFPIIGEQYTDYLMTMYDETYYPEKVLGAGRAAYVERNYEMINKSKYCIVYYDPSYAPATRKSGTKIALDYAVKKKKEIIAFPG